MKISRRQLRRIIREALTAGRRTPTGRRLLHGIDIKS